VAANPHAITRADLHARWLAGKTAPAAAMRRAPELRARLEIEEIEAVKMVVQFQFTDRRTGKRWVTPLHGGECEIPKGFLDRLREECT
jgi:hypothetical protein